MAASAPNPQEIIADYLAAYRDANGHCDVFMTYQRGWFCLLQKWTPARYRRSKVMQMTNTLRARAAKFNEPAEHSQ